MTLLVKFIYKRKTSKNPLKCSFAPVFYSSYRRLILILKGTPSLTAYCLLKINWFQSSVRLSKVGYAVYYQIEIILGIRYFFKIEVLTYQSIRRVLSILEVASVLIEFLSVTWFLCDYFYVFWLVSLWWSF